MKVAILTIRDDSNYGNRLQNYAMQQILKKKNINVITLSRRYNLKSLSLYKSIKIKFKKYITILFHFLGVKSNRRRYNFYAFNKRIKFYKKEIKYEKSFYYLDSKFDYFIIGSDQIWNPKIFKDDFDINFLPGIYNFKKIPVSPSIALDHFDKEEVASFTKNLNEFKVLSCREKGGSVFLNKILDKKCITLIDPTLVLSANEWDKVINKPSFFKLNEYILVYNLGELSNETKKYIDGLLKKVNTKVVYLNKKNNLNWSCGPSEFLYLIKNAKIIVTDSYHGSIFSIIYEKPLKIIDRSDCSNMSSRLVTLKELFDYYDFDLDDIRVNYSKIKLKKEIEKFKNYLKINIIGED